MPAHLSARMDGAHAAQTGPSSPLPTTACCACWVLPPSLQAVLLSQLDAVRRELVDVVDQSLPHITFGKEVVREVLAFAQVGRQAGGGCASGPSCHGMSSRWGWGCGRQAMVCVPPAVGLACPGRNCLRIHTACACVPAWVAPVGSLGSFRPSWRDSLDASLQPSGLNNTAHPAWSPCLCDAGVR